MMWEKVRLGDVCNVISGFAFKSDDYKSQGMPLLRISNIINEEINFKEDCVCIEESHFENLKKFQVIKNDILIALSGATTGKYGVYKLETPALLNQRVGLIRAKDNLDRNFLLHYFNLLKKDIEYLAQGAAQPNISPSEITNLQIPLPPLPIQKRIAEILDTADALRRKDEALLKKYDELAQAIFIDMFGDPVKNEKGWEVKKFSEVSNKITDGEHTTPIRQSEGIHLLSARNIQNGYISLKNGVDYISESEYNRISKRCNPEFGDILLSCSGSVGRCTVYRSSDKIGLVRSVALIKPKHEQINSTYFEFSIRSEFLQNQILQNSSKSSQANLFTGKIKELNILVPHIELQKKFESIIELLTKQVSIKKNKNSENLFHSLLQKAFNGELVK